MSRRYAVLPLLLLALPAASAQAGESESALAVSTPAMAKAMRGLLLQFLPDPLHEASPGWGRTDNAPSRITWDGLKPEIVYTRKNDGTWKKIRVAADNPAQTLWVDLRGFRRVDDERTRFNALIWMNVRVDYHQQNWKKGIKLWDATVRARLRLKLALKCEATTRVEKTNGVLPDVVFRLRVLHAELRHDNLEVEHVAGIGGDGARVLGDLVERAMREFHPSLERRMLAKAHQAIVKAGDTKEVRLGLGALLKTER